VLLTTQTWFSQARPDIFLAGAEESRRLRQHDKVCLLMRGFFDQWCELRRFLLC